MCISLKRERDFLSRFRFLYWDDIRRGCREAALLMFEPCVRDKKRVVKTIAFTLRVTSGAKENVVGKK